MLYLCAILKQIQSSCLKEVRTSHDQHTHIHTQTKDILTVILIALFSCRKFLSKTKKVKDGMGIMRWQDGSRYLGQFSDDKMEGKGRMTQANGSVYQGQWSQGMANGIGTFIDSEGSTYDGEWKNDLQHGFGCETWSQGKIKFEGNYVQGKKNGRGKYEWSDGSYYEGEFYNSVFQGEGKSYKPTHSCGLNTLLC